MKKKNKKMKMIIKSKMTDAVTNENTSRISSQELEKLDSENKESKTIDPNALTQEEAFCKILGL